MKIVHQGTLYVEGPAIVEKLSGKLFVAGAEFDRLIVPKHKGTALWLPEESEIKVELMEGGSIKYSPERPRPAERDELVERIADRERILVVGPVDSGKSFLTVFLANKLNAQRILDTDVGQGVISPPCTIGLAKIDEPVPFLSYLKADKMVFVGSTTPSKFTSSFLSGVLKLAHHAQGKTIIDTTGWVKHEGMRLKIAKAEMLDAKVVLIEKEPMDYFKRALEARGIEYVSVPPLEMVTERSKEVRRDIRSSLYAKRLTGIEFYSVSRDKVYGRPETIEKLEDPDLGFVGLKIGEKEYPKDELIGLIVGIERNGYALGIGYVADLTLDGVTVATNVKEFDYVRIGIVKISPETLEEVGRLE